MPQPFVPGYRVAASGGAAPELKGIKIPVNNKSIAGYVANSGQSYIENDTRQSPFFSGQVDEQTNYVTRKLIAVPLKVQYNRLYQRVPAWNGLDLQAAFTF